MPILWLSLFDTDGLVTWPGIYDGSPYTAVIQPASECVERSRTRLVDWSRRWPEVFGDISRLWLGLHRRDRALGGYVFDLAGGNVGCVRSWQLRPIPGPWVRLPVEGREVFEAELRAETSPGHPLHGTPVIAVLRCAGCDDVVFSVEEEPVRFVLVHLTWRRGPEAVPWPWTRDLALPLSDSLAGHVHLPLARPARGFAHAVGEHGGYPS